MRFSSESSEEKQQLSSPTTPIVPTDDLASSQRPSQTSRTLDEKLVDWESPSDPQNPFNFPLPKKWRTTLLTCFMTFIVQVSGTMLTSAAEQINASFNISDEAFPHSYWPVLSWNLGGAAAPLLGLPLMENFGVRWSYLVRTMQGERGGERDVT
jgi:hypothetical protein